MTSGGSVEKGEIVEASSGGFTSGITGAPVGTAPLPALPRQQRLYFFPLPQKHGSLRLSFIACHQSVYHRSAPVLHVSITSSISAAIARRAASLAAPDISSSS